MELNDADFMTLRHLTFANGQVGLLAHNASDNLTGSYLTATGHSQDGIRVEAGSTVTAFDHLYTSNNLRDGIFIGGTIGAFSNSIAHSNGSHGITLANAGAPRIENNSTYNNGNIGLSISTSGNALIEGNESYFNRTGVSVVNSGPVAVFGNADLTLSRGNKVHDNSQAGISAGGSVLVTGNLVYGQSGSEDVGITLDTGVEATRNVVFGNYNGIDGSGLIRENRVYANTNVGIRSNIGTVRGNVVYSNTIGVEVTSSVVANNLVYANSGLGIRGWGGNGSQVVNNTVYQVVGDAVRLEGVQNGRLRNNVLVVDSGYAINVSNNSQVGFQSDNNLIYVTGTGKVGFWQGLEQATLSAWRRATFTDSNSLSTDPLFVNPHGADSLLGYFAATSDGRDDDFHLMSLYGSYHSGSPAPTLSMISGLPVLLAPVLTSDASQSPGIDRGDAADSFSSEPSPNGGYINLGAFGNTAQASLSPTEYVNVLGPDGGETWLVGQTFSIRWRSHNKNGNVDIDLMQDGNPTPIFSIAASTANDGEYNWLVPDTVPFGTDYRVRVTRNGVLSDSSNAVFTVAGSVNAYYVNDGTVEAGDWTTAPGNDANDGLSPSTPKASVRSILEAYDLGSGDRIRIDAGTYNLTTNLLITANDSGAIFEGYHDAAYPDRAAVLSRGSSLPGSYVIELSDADDITIDHLVITGGEYGVYAALNSDSDRLKVSSSRILGNAADGVRLESGNDLIEVVGSMIYGNQLSGIYLADTSQSVIAHNLVYSNTQSGIYLAGTSRSVVSENLVYGNGFSGIHASGPSLAADRIVIIGNTVRDNAQYGISAYGQVLVTGNTVTGHTSSYAGIYVQSAEVADNVVYGNTYGIHAYGGIARNNRVYANSISGIRATNDALIAANVVYSNPIGIHAYQTYVYSAQLLNNLVYANTNQGILIEGSTYYYYVNQLTTVTNNTVYQSTGDAIRIETSIENVQLRNNILWVDAGYAINVADDSQTGFNSDYNILYPGVAGSIGVWNGVVRNSLVDWQNALLGNSDNVGREIHSLAGDPLFADIDGADNVLGYTTSRGGYDGGRDDNFYRIKRSIAIDSGDTWAAPATDIEGFTRRDDPGTPNTGSPNYEETTLGGSQFAAVGTARNWRNDGASFTLAMPFSFPFYGVSYTSLSVSTEGFLLFGSGSLSGGDSVNSAEKLRNNRMIAPLWDNLRTNGTGNDIFVDSSTAGQTTIRWNATNAADSSDVNFSVTLFSDGNVQFDYGAGNTNLTPTVGISRGDGRFYIESAYDGRTALTNVDSIDFRLTQGKSFVDIGAYEFRGSSDDENPPTVVSVTPAFIADSGSADATFDTITVTFSEDINPIDANAAANYELRHPGVDGVFDNEDDLTFALTATYDSLTSLATLSVTLPDGRLSAGRYRFTVFDNISHSLHDLAGLRLDADDNPATISGSYIRNFTVGNLPPVLDSIADQIVAEGIVLTLNGAAHDNDVGDVLTYSLANGAPVGATINASTGVFTWTPNESQGPGTYSITVRVTDSGSPQKSDAKTFQVTVREVNQTPVLAPIGNHSIDEGANLQFQVLATDFDLPINALTYSLIGAPSGASIDASRGLFSWAPGETAGPGMVVFTVRVTDSGSPILFSEEQITVAINEINTPPVLDRLLNRSVKEGELVTFTAKAQDIDVPVNTLRFSLDQPAPVGATIDAITGVFTWAPTQAGTYDITVRVSDDGVPPLSMFQVITIKVFPTNVSPALAPISNYGIDEQTLLTFAAAASDVNPTDLLTFSLVNAPLGASIDSNTGVFRWTPTELQGAGSYTFKVRTTDNGSPNLSDEKELTVIVREVNLRPTLDPIGDKVFNEGSNRTFTVLAKDTDFPLNVLSYSLIGAPAGAVIDATSGLFSWTPSEAQGPGTFNVTVRVTDNGTPALVAEEVITLSVNEVNQPPVLATIGNQSVQEESTLTFIALANDADLPSQVLTFSLIGAPIGATIDSVTGEFAWTPTVGQGAGDFTFIVRIADDGAVNLFADEEITVTVNALNQPPVLNVAASNVTGNVLQELTNTGTWRDPESGPVTLAASLGNVSKHANGTWVWSHTASTKLDNQLVTITADDGTNVTSVAFNITTRVHISNSKVYYKGSGFASSGTNVPAALDPSKILAQAGSTPLTLTYANLINTTRGINGIVLDIAGLVATSLTTNDFGFRMSPQGLFAEAANPPSSWPAAPEPTAIFVTPGTATTPARIRLEWADNAIANRWLQIRVIANSSTGLSDTQVYYIGHLQGELNGQLIAGSYFVTNADLTMVLPVGGGIAPVTDRRDVDKNRFVSNADGVAIRDAVIAGYKLRNITIPISGSSAEGANSVLRGSRFNALDSIPQVLLPLPPLPEKPLRKEFLLDVSDAASAPSQPISAPPGAPPSPAPTVSEFFQQPSIRIKSLRPSDVKSVDVFFSVLGNDFLSTD